MTKEERNKKEMERKAQNDVAEKFVRETVKDFPAFDGEKQLGCRVNQAADMFLDPSISMSDTYIRVTWSPGPYPRLQRGMSDEARAARLEKRSALKKEVLAKTIEIAKAFRTANIPCRVGSWEIRISPNDLLAFIAKTN